MTKALATSKAILNGTTITLKDFEQAIDNEIAMFKETGDTTRIDNILTTMKGMEHFSKFTQCKVIYHYKLWWDEQEYDENEFYERHRTTAKKVVLERYISLWDKYEKNVFPAEIKERPLDDQIKIAKALDEGYEIKEEIWDELIEAENSREVHTIIQQKVKGKKPSKNSYVPVLKENGQIIVHHQGQAIPWGFINLPEIDDIDELSKELNDETLSDERKEYIITQRVLHKMLARLKNSLSI